MPVGMMVAVGSGASVGVGGAGVGAGGATVTETVGAGVYADGTGVEADVGGASVERRVGARVNTDSGLAACVAARVEVGVRVYDPVGDEVRAGEAVGTGSPPQPATVSKHKVATTAVRRL